MELSIFSRTENANRNHAATGDSSLLRFSLYHFVNKISCFNRPTLGNFSFFYLNLFWQYMFSYFFSRLSYIRSSSIHAFICHYTYCKIINCCGVILSAHYFRCHISRCSRSVLSIFSSPNSCNSEIRYS